MSEWLELAEWDWVELPTGDRLHAVGRLDNESTIDDDWYGEGATACGRRGQMAIPGIGSRMLSKRCEQCCARTGMPLGVGSPKNDDACRPVAEARLAARNAGQSAA